MFENIKNFLKKFSKNDKIDTKSKDTAKERLHLVLMQDRANVSADFLELMKQEIIEVIKKYIDVDESAIDVKLTNKANTDGTVGAPALYANIPIVTIKNEARQVSSSSHEEKKKETEKKEEISEIEKKEEENVLEKAEIIIEEADKEQTNNEEEKKEEQEEEQEENKENKNEEVTEVIVQDEKVIEKNNDKNEVV